MRPLNEILSHSPHETLRDIQTDAIRTAYEILQTEKRFVVLELPPGVGKSAVGWILAHAYERGYFLTIQKLLQDQYTKELGDKMVVLKGQNFYQCAAHPEYTCEDSVCSVKKSIRELHAGTCPYRVAVEKAVAADFSLFNMHSFYYQYRYGWFAGQKREVMVVDEGHLIENSFMSLIETTLGEDSYAVDIPQYSRTVDYLPYLKDVLERVRSEAGAVEDADEERVDAAMVRRVLRLRKTMAKLQALISDMESGREWVHAFDEDRRSGKTKLVFKPLYVDHFIQEYLYSAADKIIIMSATIGSFKEFCKRSGIPKEQAAIIRGPSPFPVENRQVHYHGVGSMGRKNFESTFPKLIKQLAAILELHSKERGIIQAHSEWLAAKIVQALRSPRVTAKNGDVQQMLSTHARKSNSVIVAAGVATGLDLKDDLSRFQVIVKVPYPDLGDVQMRRRFELSQDYYFYLTGLTLMQAYGRSVRSETDSAVTYILDSDFGRYMHFHKHFLSDWFLEAVVKE